MGLQELLWGGTHHVPWDRDSLVQLTELFVLQGYGAISSIK